MCPWRVSSRRAVSLYWSSLSGNSDMPRRKTEKYIGLTARPFIQRHKEHYRYFDNRNPKNSTSLSRKIWKLKDRNLNFEIKWKIIQSAKPYQPGSRHCYLCLSEIYFIIFQPEEATLNDRSEVMNKCRHSNKFKLCKF